MDDVRLRAELESRVWEYLGNFDEEPMGVAYYPYATLLYILMALPILAGKKEEISFRNLYLYAQRFAAHVDWQLRNSRVSFESDGYFERYEERIWLGHARLGARAGTVLTTSRCWARRW
ncbi:hypothetical protein GCM10022254_43660 [Actinomadura meridiana]|uniref:Uncharacterized protein n=1 Tax=Actinomadura meridiana TaxID=559626 RepID=A0ABP8C9D6_9ACTN